MFFIACASNESSKSVHYSSLARASTTSVHLGDVDTQLFIAFSNHESTGFHWNKKTDPTPSRKKLDLPWIKLTPPSGTLNSIVFLEFGPLCKIDLKSHFLSVCPGPSLPDDNSWIRPPMWSESNCSYMYVISSPQKSYLLMRGSRKFCQRGPRLRVFLVDERIQIPQYEGQHRPASESPFKWRFACLPLVAQHLMLAW